MRSKFSVWAYFVFCYTVLFCCMFLATIPTIIYFHLQPYIFFAIIALFVAFVCAWLILGELRSKVVTVDMGFDSFKFRRFLGLGPEKTIYFDQLDGFKISYLPTSATVYEYLYIISGEKKVVKLSQFYHKNYLELKQAITESLKNLGEEDFSYAREFKEIFV
jgi:hypothetical protein